MPNVPVIARPCCRFGMHSFTILNALVEECGRTNLMQLASGSNRETQPVFDTEFTSCQERQDYPVSRGAMHVQGAWTMAIVPLGRHTSLTTLTEGRASSMRWAERFTLCNPCIYVRGGRSPTAPLSDAAGGSRHTMRQDSGRQLSSGREAPSCPKSVNSHASGRGNSSERHSRRGVSRYASQGSVHHRASPPNDVVEVGTPDPTPSLDQPDV